MAQVQETNRVFALLADLVERNPEFDYKRSYTRLSTASERAALMYVRQKLAQLADDAK